MFPASCKVLLTSSSPDRWGPIAVVKGLRISSPPPGTVHLTYLKKHILSALLLQ